MKMRRLFGMLAGGVFSVLAFGTGGPQAWAQADPTPAEPIEAPLSEPIGTDPAPATSTGQPMTERVTPELQTTPGEWYPRSRVGMSLLVGGGVTDFANSSIESQTGLGGSWNLRLTSGTRLPFAWEVAYMGGANDVTRVGVPSDAYMLNTTVEGNLRFNAPIVTSTTLLEPFAIAGAGWTRYNVINSGLLTGTSKEDDQFIVPLGAGFAVGYQGFTAEARFTYRFAFDDEMFGNEDMGTWNVTAGLGAEF